MERGKKIKLSIDGKATVFQQILTLSWNTPLPVELLLPLTAHMRQLLFYLLLELLPDTRNTHQHRRTNSLQQGHVMIR